MGNTSSSSNKDSRSKTIAFNPSLNLKFKSGIKQEPIPFKCPPSTSLDKLFMQADFKIHLYRNLDSSYLLTSFLHLGNDDSFLLEGIDFFKFSDLNTRQEITNELKSFGNMINSGIPVILILLIS